MKHWAWLKIVVISLIFVGLPQTSRAGSDSPIAKTSNDFHTSCQAAFLSDPYDSTFAKMAKAWRAGIGIRGFLGSNPPETPETSMSAEKFGIIGWTLYMFVVPNLEEAKAHAGQPHEPIPDKKDSITGGLYFIGEPQDEVTDQGSAHKTLTKLIEKGGYYFPDPTNTKTYIYYTPQKLKKIFDMQKVNPIWMTEDPRVGPKMVLYGWALPKKRGMIQFSDLFNSSTLKKIQKEFIRPYFLRGDFRVTFNQAFVPTLNALRDQKRRFQNQTQNRYFDPNQPDGISATYRTMLGRLQNGSAFSVEVWDPKGELIAGTIAVRTGNVIAPDSVHYAETVLAPKVVTGSDQSEITFKEVAGVNFAKVAVIALIERLHEAGIEAIDTGMVSHFTAGLKGQYVPTEDFLKWMKRQNHEAPVDIPFHNWSPQM